MPNKLTFALSRTSTRCEADKMVYLATWWKFSHNAPKTTRLPKITTCHKCTGTALQCMKTSRSNRSLLEKPAPPLSSRWGMGSLAPFSNNHLVLFEEVDRNLPKTVLGSNPLTAKQLVPKRHHAKSDRCKACFVVLLHVSSLECFFIAGANFSLLQTLFSSLLQRSFAVVSVYAFLEEFSSL